MGDNADSSLKRLADQGGCPYASASKRAKIDKLLNRNNLAPASNDGDKLVSDTSNIIPPEDLNVKTEISMDSGDPNSDISASDGTLNRDDSGDAGANSDLDIDEILEADVDEAVAKERGEYNVYEKIILKRQPKDLFNELPDSWVEVIHDSGLVVYLHKPTRVCTFGRPYFLGPGSARHHAVPPSAIPCLYQKKLAEEDAVNKQAQKEHEEKLASASDNSTTLLSSVNAPLIKIVDAGTQRSKDLAPSDLHEYAAKAFEFEKITFRRYKEWNKARQHFKELKRMTSDKANLASTVQRPTLPSDAKLITIPSREKNKPYSKDFALNPKGKTALAILHEYAQKVLKSTVEYDIFDVPPDEGATDANNHFYTIAKIRISPQGQSVMAGLTLRERLVIIQAEYEKRLKSEGRSDVDIGQTIQGVVVVGQGKGAAKKASRMSAAVNALEILIPELTFNPQGVADENVKKTEDELEIFDLLSITDTRIAGFSHRLGQPMPYTVLQSCLEKCKTFAKTNLEVKTNKMGHSKIEVILKVADDKEVSVTARNVIDGKQKAAQQMLQILYPHLEKYGTIMRLYGIQNKQTMRLMRQGQKAFQKATSIVDQESKRLRRVQKNESFLRTLRGHMIDFAKKGPVEDPKGIHFYTRLTPMVAEDADVVAEVSQTRADKEGDHFMSIIPRVLDIHKQQDDAHSTPMDTEVDNQNHNEPL
uniref:DRBM domain-containing protein n=1 Tax=Panagrellus redivivus TaxID=6233 RepID=A0A7E4V3K8_PANRE